MLQLNNLAVASRLSSFSTKVLPGMRVHIIGPNGAGKSTLLASVAGMLNAEGEVLIFDKSIGSLSGYQLSQLRSYLCQQYLPFSTLPVFQYLSLHQPQGSNPQQLEKTLTLLCERLHLTDKLGKAITRLSGGEWQRVRLVAALLQIWPTLNPQGVVLLLDEPATSLDIAHQLAIDLLINEFCAAGGIAVISSHDLNHTLHQADLVWLMSEGKVIATGSANEVLQPDRLSLVYGVSFQLHHVSGKPWIMTY